MRFSGKTVVTTAAALAAAMAIGGGAVRAAEPMTIKFSDPIPPFASLHKEVLAPWAAKITKDSHGALDVKVFAGPGVTNLGNSYDRTVNGVVDIAWGILSPITTQFPKTNVVTLPFETRNGTEATMGLWSVYKQGLLDDEWSKVHLLAVATFPGIYLHSSKPIKTMADMKGLKISADARVPSLALERLGASPVHMPVSELYQASQRGTLDAIAIAWPAIMAFKLFETTKYHLEVPLGNDGAFVVMNKASYAKLPAEGKAAIDQNSGDVLTKLILGDVTHSIAGARAATGKMPGHVISRLAPDEQARWVATVRPVVEQWEKNTKGGAKVLAAYRAAIQKIRAMKN